MKSPAKDGTKRGKERLPIDQLQRNLIAFKVNDALFDKVMAAKGEQTVAQFMREMLEEM